MKTNPLTRLRTALRDRGDGRRPYHAVVERRADDSKQLPDAVQGMQPAKVEQIGGEKQMNTKCQCYKCFMLHVTCNCRVKHNM